MNDLSTTIVIFGASGDLTRRKLIPGLYNNFRKGRLPKEFRVVGQARTVWSDDEFRNQMISGIKEFSAETYDEATCKAFCHHLHYVPGSFDEDHAFASLRERCEELEQGDTNRLYYLSIAPRFFLLVVQQMDDEDMVKEYDGKGWRRVVVEKPFGTDLESAKQLNHDLHKYLNEHQIYRIDHYLAKETVQNLMIFRFANTIFEPLWNRNYIDHVQITAVESVDVGRRGGYYDQSGVMRDMVQNHLMQLTALVAMEPPASFDADAVRNEKVKVLQSIRPIPAEGLKSCTVRAQYDGYLDAERVAPDSTTPTYAAIKFFIDNWRWRDVPFYLRSGKGLETKTTEIIIQFKKPPHLMFPIPDDYAIRSNYLAICLQPHEAIHLRFEAKVPDTDATMKSVIMDFEYEDFFDEATIPEAYERLLLEALEGDATLFTRSDGIEAAWTFIDGILQGWDTDNAPAVSAYEKGSWGPKEADILLENDGRKWRYECADHD